MEQDNKKDSKNFWQRCWNALKLFFFAFVNIRFAFCFFLSWMITNGWAYIGIVAGTVVFDLPWLASGCLAYLGFLWLPFICEKLVQIPIAIYLSRLLFPNDNKTVESLHAMKEALIERRTEKREARANKNSTIEATNDEKED